MPAYNTANYIAEAIESVLLQDYTKLELIIVDDGSTDETAEVVKHYEDKRIKYFRKKNGGASSARNLAIEKSTGQYIIPLDGDDRMTFDFVSQHLKTFEENPQADLVYCDDRLIDNQG
ncbi:MAG TPA: glycosyltransferase family A protein, partial [Sedimentisphaerales bacterium]|nr:glycosyltransferase family A protein [Sedimentisphaerales bacterium]